MPGRLAARRPRPGNTRAAAAAAYCSSVAASSSVLPDELDRSSDAYACNAAAVGGLLSDLRSRVSQIILGLQNFDRSNVASVVTAADKHVPKTNGDIPSFDEAFSDHRRLLDRLVLYVLVELKGNGDGNCQVYLQDSVLCLLFENSIKEHMHYLLAELLVSKFLHNLLSSFCLPAIKARFKR
ncbi:uncharacterized protein LOC119338429 isoform X1 [Triticum dicoccoides]|uniref:uncharacterized protein LOC119338429 isoform X1 n=1 Tax=Triticum dicoccoides TaxID=85692 RepID=UPI0018913280|nr:uncharacterized protein LOC119338429 isoform X1 [Triticum dicoccoides]